MCENRERLIGYVYDECEPAERKAIEEHLESCHTCRQEIRGLRSVRQDLLAWDVPASEPIWRPIAPVRQEPTWRLLPTWALAAAACAMFMVGAAGGAATYALMPRSTPAVAEARPTPMTAPASVTPAELAALESKVLARMRNELDSRVRQVPAESGSRSVSNINTDDLLRRVNLLTSRQDELSDVLLNYVSQTNGIRIKQSDLERDNRNLVTYLQGSTGGFPGGQ